jgi:sec-independent protein translocase protein TatA
MTLAFGMPGSWEWILILLVALLIFGRRLPDVARSVGKSIVEFKKGIRDVKDDIDDQTRIEPPRPAKLEDHSKTGAGSAPSNDAPTTSGPSATPP